MRTRLFSILFLLLTAVMGTWAQNVTPEQAKQIAAQFLQGKRTDKSSKRAPGQNELKTAVVFNAKDTSGQPYLYSVTDTRQSGFVLVSGDERFNAVLGYSDDGTFDEQNMPENMRVFLQDYIDEMKYLLSINYQPSESARRTAPAGFDTIEPLMTTTWNQDNPYNKYCPQYDNYGNKCPTGCLATALAQVMRYQGLYKKAGQSTTTLKAIPAYTTSTMKYNILEKPIRTFDWTKMTGTTPSTSEAKEEVARLMEYIGSGVKIDYRQGGTGGSVSYIPSLMTDVFGYDSKVREVNRNNYSDYEWLNMMYHELSTNGPVMYSGQATNGGHGFVLDGYKYENDEHLFHINWGWGGMSDGYFLLSVCYPDEQGIGGSTSQAGFNRAQGAIIDMNPNGSGTQPSDIRLYDYKITLGKTSFTRNSSSESFQLTGIQHQFANILSQAYTFDFGVGWVNTNGEITLLAEYTTGYSLNYGRAINCTNATYYTPTGVTDGEYRLIGISKEHGTNTWWRNYNSENYYIRATVSGDQLTLEICNANSIQLTGSMTTTGNTAGQAVTVTASVTNNGSLYSGNLMLAQIESGGSPVIVDQKQVEIAKGTTATVNFSYTPTKAGNFTLVLLNKQNQTFGSQQSITINAATGGTQIYTVRNSQGRDIKYQKDGIYAIVVAGGNYSGNVVLDSHVYIGGGMCMVGEIGPQAFYNTSLTDITIPSTVTRINTNAFYGSTLRSVTYQGTSGLQRIEAGAFSGLNYLTTITIPASVNYIGNSAFAGSSQLASVTALPTTPATIGSNVFAGNASGRNIYVPDQQVNTYKATDGWSTYASDIVSQLSVGQTFEEGDLTYEITNATEGSKAVKLTSSTATGAVEIPSSVKGFTVTAIGADAFKNTTVTSVVIPATVTAIGANAFSGCSNLTSVTIWATAVPTLASDIFSGANASLEIFVYGNLVDDYQTALSDVSSKIKPIQFTEANTADVNINYDMMSSTEARVSRNAAATGALEIPATVYHQGTNYSVTSIAEGAFQNCTGLSSVILPESITEIGAEAFSGCSNLSSVTIWATSVPTLADANAFSSTPNFYIWGDLKDSYVDATNWSSFAPMCYNPITYTTDGIKYELASATSATVVSTSPKYSGDIVIPANITLRGHTLNVTGIGDEAFDNCSGVTSVSIPESVTSIGRYAFYNCTGLREVMIPNSVTSVGYSAFEGCTNLNEASLGTGVTSIDSRAFYGCTNLYRVTVFATTVPTLGTQVFDQNASGRRIYVPADSKAYYKAATNWNAYADYIFDISTATGFQSGEFDFVITNDNVGERTVEVTGVHDVWTPMTIPSTVVNDGNTYTVTSIAANAFAERRVFNAEIPSTVTSIGNQAFYHCNTLGTVKMESATPPVLGTEVFDGHYQGQSVQDMFHIRVPLTSIVAYQESGNWASYGSDITAWFDGNIADGIYYSFDDGKLTVNNAPYDAPYEGHIVIPEEVCGFPVVAIGAFAFANDEAGQYNKKKCNATSVTIPNTVTKIENFAFLGSHITSIEIPNSVTTIEQQAFLGCSSLTSVTIGNGISSIGNNAFDAHTQARTYTIHALIPPTLGTTPFPTNGVGTFYVPSSSEADYEAAWPTYSLFINQMTSFAEDGINYGIINEDDKTAKVLASTYTGDLVIPEWVNGYQVTSIDEDAFKDCTSLTSVSIPSTVTAIGSGAFWGCSNLSTVIVNSTSVPSLGSIQTFDGNATGRKIFVVSSLWNDYKAYESSWHNYASDILPFVDYEEGSWIGEADEVGFTTRQLKNYTHVTSSTTTFEDGKWYVVTEGVTNNNRITVQGTAHLVLCDGVTMYQDAGFGVTGGNTLNIYGQSEGTGCLFANSNGRYAAIGGNSDNSNCGTVNIHGGEIYCSSSAYGAGIGGGQGGNGGTVTIFGGKVNTSSTGSVGIGMGAGGADDGTLSLGANTIVLGGLYQYQTMQLERPYNSRFTIMNVTPALILDEDIDNSEAIAQADGKTMAVSMKRTLKAGGWNTFCMPCTVSGGFLSKVLGNDVQMKKLTGSSFDESTGELNLTFADAEEIQGAKTIEAGKPYLVKVSQDVINPLFTSAVVHREVTNTETEYVDFIPVMLPADLQGGDKSILFDTENDEFTYPSTNTTMLGFRGYIKIHNDVAPTANWVNIDFGGGETTSVSLLTYFALSDGSDNTDVIDAHDREKCNVALSGRTLIKDGKWNTLCLPFDFTAAQIAAHADFAGAKLMELDTNGTNGFDATNGTLYLAFKEATAIKAGVPYLVKWDAAGTDVTSPVFFGVTINATASTTVSDHDDELAEVQMKGCYSPVSVVADDKSILFMGGDNTLYYSAENRSIRSCRAYFSVPYINQTPGAKARAFVLNFDDEEATGILEISADSKEKKDDAWYSLAGVRLSGKPTQRGMYINKGNKVIIK